MYMYCYMYIVHVCIVVYMHTCMNTALAVSYKCVLISCTCTKISKGYNIPQLHVGDCY